MEKIKYGGPSNGHSQRRNEKLPEYFPFNDTLLPLNLLAVRVGVCVCVPDRPLSNGEKVWQENSPSV